MLNQEKSAILKKSHLFKLSKETCLTFEHVDYVWLLTSKGVASTSLKQKFEPFCCMYNPLDVFNVMFVKLPRTNEFFIYGSYINPLMVLFTEPLDARGTAASSNIK